jgi:hypothetical protein
VTKHWRSIGAVLLLLAALAPISVVLDVWRVWEGWTLDYWNWAVNLTNDVLLLTTVLCLVGALMCVLGRRRAARNLTIAALVGVAIYIVGYTLLQAALVDTSIWASVGENLRYWLLGIGYDEVGAQTFFPSQILAGPVAWMLMLAALVVIVRAGRSKRDADAPAALPPADASTPPAKT